MRVEKVGDGRERAPAGVRRGQERAAKVNIMKIDYIRL